MVLGVADNLHTSAVRPHFVAFGHAVAGVVGALGLHVRMDFAYQRPHVRLIENYYGVHVGQSGNDLGALGLRHHRTPLALQPPRAAVGVHRHHQLSAQRLGAAQIADVPHVQQVEAAVGQHDLLALSAPLCDPRCEFLACNDLVGGLGHDLFAAANCSTAASNSVLDTVAVPSFITTMPPARFASRAADGVSALVSSAAVKVEITVSPAPVTSNAWSEPKIGIVSGGLFFSNATMPSRPRVTTSDSRPMRCITCAPAASSRPSSRPILIPNASSTSGSLGVAAVAPTYSNMR